MDIITRKEAISKGLPRYFTGKPCSRGHIVERYVSNYECVKCEKIRAKGYRQTRPEKRKAYFKQYHKQYYKAHREELIQKNIEYTQQPHIKSKRKEYYKENRKKVREQQQEYIITHRTEATTRTKNWRNNNPNKSREYHSRRKARKLKAEGTHTTKDIKWLLEKQNYKCVYCKKSLRKEYHVDHIIALSKGGGNGKNNLQMLCPTCNLRKNAKDPIEYAQSIGLLL